MNYVLCAISTCFMYISAVQCTERDGGLWLNTRDWSLPSSLITGSSSCLSGSQTHTHSLELLFDAKNCSSLTLKLIDGYFGY